MPLLPEMSAAAKRSQIEDIAVRQLNEEILDLAAKAKMPGISPMEYNRLSQEIRETILLRNKKQELAANYKGMADNLDMGGESVTALEVAKDTTLRTRQMTRQTTTAIRQIGSKEHVERIKQDYEAAQTEAEGIIGLVSKPFQIAGADTTRLEVDDELDRLLHPELYMNEAPLQQQLLSPYQKPLPPSPISIPASSSSALPMMTPSFSSSSLLASRPQSTAVPISGWKPE
jgi:hypothetical protein